MLQEFQDYLNSLFHSGAYSPWQVGFEMIVIGVVVYTILRFLQGTRGARLLQGLVFLLVGGFVIVNVLGDHLGFERLRILFNNILLILLAVTLLVFQPELRRGLMRLGETRFRRIRQSDIDKICRPISGACAQLSKNKIGALIAIQRDVGLSGLSDQGVKLDARLSQELLLTIFWPGTALHDLGVVIVNGRVQAAGVQFPLGDAEGLDRSIGSRHRAAVGLSLDSDAVIVVVSEETGAISIAENGRLYRHIPPDALFNTLRRHLISGTRKRGRREDAESPPHPRTREEDEEEDREAFEADTMSSPAAPAREPGTQPAKALS
jgi:diadenylate cyclase